MRFVAFSSILMLFMLFILSKPAEAGNYKEYNHVYWAKPSLVRLAEKQILIQDKQGFNGKEPITRAQFISMLVKIMNLQEKNGKFLLPFTDISETDQHVQPIRIAVQHHLIKGKENNRFDPESPLTREEMAVIMIRHEGLHPSKQNGQAQNKAKDDHRISPWARPFVEQAMAKGIIKGHADGRIYPKRIATKAEAAVLLDRMAFGDPPPLNEKVVKVGGSIYPYSKEMKMKSSAYGPFVGSRTATGKRVKFGMIAVDPKVIPLGTKVFVTGYRSPHLPAEGFLAVAEDTGGLIKGKKIDIFINQSRMNVMKYGIQDVRVYILQP